MSETNPNPTPETTPAPVQTSAPAPEPTLAERMAEKYKARERVRKDPCVDCPNTVVWGAETADA